jgi:hypothetical protein
MDICGDCSRVTGNPEVITSPVGLVPINALVLTGLANFQVVGYTEVISKKNIEADFPNFGRGFDSHRPLQILNE